jgi:diguanylate cyclase (GGDEF)-like protein
MGYLARAGLLLEHTSQRNGRYAAALGSFAIAAAMAGLYEIAAATYEQVAQYHAAHGRPPGNYFEQIHLELLVSWGLQLEQLGHTLEAGVQLRRAAAVSADWLDTHRETPQSSEALEMVAFRALALAKLGHADQAIALAQQVVEPLGTSDLFGRSWIAHLALGVGLRARGDLSAARRELLAAQQFCGDRSGWIGHELILAHELANIDAQIHGPQISGALVEALRLQSRLLWQQRLQRLAMLRQARHREELETERVHTQTTLLRDPLTGLGNRRLFDQLMTAIDAAELPGPTSLLIVDVDEFKAVNDTHSHSAGDQVLRELAATLAAHCRDSRDIPVRYAGDEFTVFLNADLPAAAEIAERIRTAVAATNLDHITPGMPITISVGVAELHPGMTAAELFHAADANLYQAKRNGRDRVAA